MTTRTSSSTSSTRHSRSWRRRWAETSNGLPSYSSPHSGAARRAGRGEVPRARGGEECLVTLAPRAPGHGSRRGP
eukprot:4815212-Pyramimonas_sp.AAC.1